MSVPIKGRRLAALGLMVTACGSVATATPTPPCRAAPVLASPHASATPVAADADRARVDPGSTVTMTETVTGPASLRIDCSQPLQLIVADSSDLSVYSGYSAAAAPGACGDLSVAVGAEQSYQVGWPVDPSLPGGTYTATLVLGNAPQLTLDLAVGALPRTC